MEWTRILAYITGTVDQELLLRNEYLAAENRILMAKLNGRPRFSDVQRATLGEIRQPTSSLSKFSPCEGW
jgi:putative transposase